MGADRRRSPEMLSSWPNLIRSEASSFRGSRLQNPVALPQETQISPGHKSFTAANDSNTMLLPSRMKSLRTCHDSQHEESG